MKGHIKIFKFYLLLLGLTATDIICAQTLPVGTPLLEDYYRRQQLLGKLDSNISFSIRPLHNLALRQSNVYTPDSNNIKTSHRVLATTLPGLKMELLPISWLQQTNTKYPSGYNDGGMIPARGYQTQVSVGIWAQYGGLEIQVKPEYTYASNKDYPGFNSDQLFHWQGWYMTHNNIDMPERFGEGAYRKLNLGQSYIRYNYKALSLGLSTENLWWGPGMYNSLLMSNTAPGFPHLTLNTNRPIKTGIGSFEGQLVGGQLRSSGYTPTPLGNPAHFDYLYQEKPPGWRYFSGFVMTYQPKWLPGLFIGHARSYIVYRHDMGNSLSSFLPFFGPGSWTDPNYANVNLNSEQRKNRDGYKSYFFRWALPSGQAEFYGEYGRTDPAWDARDLKVELEHSRAYTLGLRKLFILPGIHQDQLQFNFELTQLASSRTNTIRSSPQWYVSGIVRDGYTHRGQILGAGAGPGSSTQTFNFSWLRGIKQLGLTFQRYEHNSDFYFNYIGDIRKNWVDLSIAAYGEWNYKNLLFNAKIQYINALNYQYELEELVENAEGPEFWQFFKQDKANMFLQLGLMYRF
ncbi:capsule assembly Wzi family protein [Olivibacter jilunii]|uniref:capsule assembly Wzi family protein n=1 Tax=Olivibacter jilunii TaxID=985016 RepID=UPI003F17907B